MIDVTAHINRLDSLKLFMDTWIEINALNHRAALANKAIGNIAFELRGRYGFLFSPLPHWPLPDFRDFESRNYHKESTL